MKIEKESEDSPSPESVIQSKLEKAKGFMKFAGAAVSKKAVKPTLDVDIVKEFSIYGPRLRKLTDDHWFAVGSAFVHSDECEQEQMEAVGVLFSHTEDTMHQCMLPPGGSADKEQHAGSRMIAQLATRVFDLNAFSYESQYHLLQATIKLLGRGSSDASFDVKDWKQNVMTEIELCKQIWVWTSDDATTKYTDIQM